MLPVAIRAQAQLVERLGERQRIGRFENATARGRDVECANPWEAILGAEFGQLGAAWQDHSLIARIGAAQGLPIQQLDLIARRVLGRPQPHEDQPSFRPYSPLLGLYPRLVGQPAPGIGQVLGKRRQRSLLVLRQ